MFAVGWPTALVSPAVRCDASVVALERDLNAECVALVTSDSVEIWRGLRRLGGVWRSPSVVTEEGAFLAAKWRDGRNTLAVVAEGGRVYLYHLSFHDAGETVAGIPSSRCDISKRATLRLSTPRAPTPRPPPHTTNTTGIINTSPFSPPPLSPVIEDAAAANDGTCVSVTGDADVLLVGTSTGHLVQFDWNHKVTDEKESNSKSGVSSEASESEKTKSKGTGVLSRGDQLAFAGSVVDVDFCNEDGVVAAVCSENANAKACVLISENIDLVRATARAAGVPPLIAERLTPPRWCPKSEGATVARLAPGNGASKDILAVGTLKGDILLYKTPEVSRNNTTWVHGAQPVLLRVLSVASDLGYAPHEIGSVSSVRWTNEGAVLATGYETAGVAVWTPGGCRLMCTLVQGGGVENKSGDTATRSGVERVQWTDSGRTVFTAQYNASSSGRLLQYELAQVTSTRFVDAGVSGVSSSSSLLSCHDELLAFDYGEDSNKMRRIQLPPEYAQINGAPTVVQLDDQKRKALVASKKGFVLLDLMNEKWKVFGDVRQEKSFKTIHAAWVGDVVAVCVALNDGRSGQQNHSASLDSSTSTSNSKEKNKGWFDALFGGTGDDVDTDGNKLDTDKPSVYRLRIYPTYHLDKTSCLLDFALPSRPIAMHACGSNLLVALGTKQSVDVAVYEVVLAGVLKVGGDAFATLRETHRVTLSGTAVLDVVPVPAMPRSSTSSSETSTGVDLALVFGAGGSLELLDLRSSSESTQVIHSSGVENFWILNGDRPSATPTDADYSFWTYGAHGMNVFYLPDSHLSENKIITPAHGPHDPELQFDKDVFPVCVTLRSCGTPAVEGITQRVLHGQSSKELKQRFAPTFASQPVLPPLLRYLLKKGDTQTAHSAALSFSNKPHFTHALEWLLFSALGEVCGAGAGGDTVGGATENLTATINLLKLFDQYPDVVASVARKTDSVMWPVLFKQAGDPLILLKTAIDNKMLRTAGCYLLVVRELKGVEVGDAAAAALYETALDEKQYALVGELTRWIARPAVEKAGEATVTVFGTSNRKDALSRQSQGGVGGLLGLLGGFVFGEQETAKDINDGATQKKMSTKETHDETNDLHTPRGSQSVPGGRGGVIPLLPFALRVSLRKHACALAGQVDLGNLSALCRCTDFDIGAFFTDESKSAPDRGTARLGDFPKALEKASESLRAHVERGGVRSHAWAGAGSFLEQAMNAGPQCAEWTLVTATLLRRKDALRFIFSGRQEIASAWEKGVRVCAANASNRGDHQTAQFLESLREEVVSRGE